MYDPAAEIENVPPQQHQAQVPKTPTTQAASTNAAFTKKYNAVARSGRGAGLSLRADGNGGAPSSAPRGTAAAAAPGGRTHEGDSAADPSSSSLDTSSTSSDFTGPQRVRVGNNNIASDISLSFWSLPASIPEGKSSGRPDSTTALRAALSARAPAATNASVHKPKLQRPASREPSAAGRAAVTGSSSGSGSDVRESSSRKRGRTETAPPPATTTASATSAEARQQALKWRSGVSTSSRHGDGGGVNRADEPEERVAKDRQVAAPATAAVSSSSSGSSNPAADSARPKNPFGTDISHILSWTPAPRLDFAGPGITRTGTATTATAPGGTAAVAAKAKGKDKGGGGSTAAHTTARRQQQEQQRSNRGGVKRSRQESAAPGAVAGGSPAIHPPPGAAGGDNFLRSAHEHGAAPVSTSTAARSKMTSSSLEALRVRVVKKGDDKGGDRSGEKSGGDIGDDDSEDSFEVDLKLEAYDEAVRRRSSADASSAPPRPGAMGSRSSSVPAAAAPPVLQPPSSITAPAAAEGASGLAPAPVTLALKTAPKGGSETGSGGLSKESVIAGGGDGGHGLTAAAAAAAAAARGTVGETTMGGHARASKTSNERGGSSGVVGGNRGGVGTAAAGAAPVMSRVPEEGEEDMSLTIGTGSRAPFPAPAGSNISAGGRYASTVFGGGGDGGSGALHTTGTATGGRTDPSLSLGSEQTDSSNQASGVSTGVGGGGGGGGGAGYERAGAFGSGLLGGGRTGGSSLSVAPVGGKADKSVAIAQGARGHGWSEVMVSGVRYLKTAKIGRGGSSEVFRVVAPDCEMMALKVVKVDNRVENAHALIDSYSNEIQLLKSLQGNRFIINLENSEVDRHRGLISIVLELGETDLDRLMRQKKANVAPTRVEPATLGLFPGGLDANFVRVIWQQMLNAVQAMHEQRVVHGDLKPANFVFVKGSLKLIDFGIAKAISNDTVNISRDSRLGTMNYMCPEAFEDTGNGELDPATGRQTPIIKQGRPSDIWSLGCILYQMSHGKTPFSHLSMVSKIRAITNPAHAIAIADLEDEHLANTLRACLKRDPSERATIGGAGGLLSHPYLDPIAARAALETALNAKLAAAHEVAEAKINAAKSRADARIAGLEREIDARVKRSVAAMERDIYSRHEGAVASAVKEAVAAEQARQAAGLSIAKSALKHIIATTVRVLNADESVNLDRADIDRITGLVIEMGRSGGAPTAGIRQ